MDEARNRIVCIPERSFVLMAFKNHIILAAISIGNTLLKTFPEVLLFRSSQAERRRLPLWTFP